MENRKQCIGMVPMLTDQNTQTGSHSPHKDKVTKREADARAFPDAHPVHPVFKQSPHPRAKLAFERGQGAPS
jgi:hypothetical protein